MTHIPPSTNPSAPDGWKQRLVEYLTAKARYATAERLFHRATRTFEGAGWESESLSTKMPQSVFKTNWLLSTCI
jgi:hypothetical protein